MRCLFYFCIAAIPCTAVIADVQSVHQMRPSRDYTNFHSQEILDADTQTGFVMWIKNHVKAHRHHHHTETVYVLEGEADLVLGTEQRRVKPGDVIHIPIGTIHALKITSKKPMKILTFKAPRDLGDDYDWIES